MAYTDRDVFHLASAILGEAEGEDRAGKTAVGYTIVNRSDVTGADIPDVIYAKQQFSYLNPNDPGGGRVRRGIRTDSSAWRESVEVANDILSGNVQDPTGGATYYHSNAVSPAWANDYTKTKTIGNHQFYTAPTSHVRAVTLNNPQRTNTKALFDQIGVEEAKSGQITGQPVGEIDYVPELSYSPWDREVGAPTPTPKPSPTTEDFTRSPDQDIRDDDRIAPDASLPAGTPGSGINFNLGGLGISNPFAGRTVTTDPGYEPPEGAGFMERFGYGSGRLGDIRPTFRETIRPYAEAIGGFTPAGNVRMLRNFITDKPMIDEDYIDRFFDARGVRALGNLIGTVAPGVGGLINLGGMFFQKPAEPIVPRAKPGTPSQVAGEVVVPDVAVDIEDVIAPETTVVETIPVIRGPDLPDLVAEYSDYPVAAPTTPVVRGDDLGPIGGGRTGLPMIDELTPQERVAAGFDLFDPATATAPLTAQDLRDLAEQEAVRDLTGEAYPVADVTRRDLPELRSDVPVPRPRGEIGDLYPEGVYPERVDRPVGTPVPRPTLRYIDAEDYVTNRIAGAFGRTAGVPIPRARPIRAGEPRRVSGPDIRTRTGQVPRPRAKPSRDDRDRGRGGWADRDVPTPRSKPRSGGDDRRDGGWADRDVPTPRSKPDRDNNRGGGGWADRDVPTPRDKPTLGF